MRLFVVLVYMMRKDYKKLFIHLKPPEPPVGLLDKILYIIKREQELCHARRLVFIFLTLLVVSALSITFSWISLSDEVASSGIFQFISIALYDFGIFLTFWPDSIMAFVESLPVMSLVLFAINITFVLLTFRFFLHHKRTLIEYFLHGFK